MNARWLAPAITMLVLAVPVGRVAAKNGDLIFEFSTAPATSEGQLTNLQVRPNTGQRFYLFVRNKSDDKRTVRVEVLSADGQKKLAESRIDLSQTMANRANPKPVRVKLAKPAPPMPAIPPAAGAAPPAPMPMPMPMPMEPPPPPGEELHFVASPDMTRREFVFRVRAFDDRTEADAKATGEPEKPSEDLRVVVGIWLPTDYIKPEKVRFRKQGRANLLTAEFKADAMNFSGPAPCPVDLVFPPQAGLKVEAMREGVFRRSVTAPNQTVRLYAHNMPLTGRADQGIFYLSIDGVPRAYVYRHSFATETGDSDAVVDQIPEASIRFMESGQVAVPVSIVTRPRIVPLRIEADTTQADVPIEVRLKQLPDGDVVESIARPEKRERHAYLDAATDDGGMLVTTRMGDWVIPVDLRDVRGRYLLQVLLKNPDPTKPALATFDRPLAVDDTRPEEVRLEVLPGRLTREKDGTIKHMRTQPLPVQVFAEDPESDISAVYVFFGKLPADGKIPETAVKATPPKLPGGAWAAALPLPAEPPMPPPMPGAPPMPPAAPKTPDVTAVAVNGVGLPSEPISVRIQLIDPPTMGTIKGTVAMGLKGKGLAGVQVLLLDGERKEIGGAKTNDKGEFIFENVPPGGYRVFAARPDSGTGTRGETPVRVEAGKIADGSINLTRRPQ